MPSDGQKNYRFLRRELDRRAAGRLFDDLLLALLRADERLDFLADAFLFAAILSPRVFTQCYKSFLGRLLFKHFDFSAAISSFLD